MKAKLSRNDTQHLITLIPEDEVDQLNLKAFAEHTSRVHILNCRGFQYMKSEVEFLVQPMSSRD